MFFESELPPIPHGYVWVTGDTQGHYLLQKEAPDETVYAAHVPDGPAQTPESRGKDKNIGQSKTEQTAERGGTTTKPAAESPPKASRPIPISWRVRGKQSVCTVGIIV